MPGIFISYRREDSSAYAGRIYDHLTNRFGKENVFMDVDNIEPGLDFVEVLQQTVSSCDALIAVIGKQWLVTNDDEGHRRLDDPGDLVRLEIAAALDRKVRVVPILVGGARMPRAQDLPEAIAFLSRRNSLEISDLAFHQGVSRLIETLEKIVSSTPSVEKQIAVQRKSLQPPKPLTQDVLPVQPPVTKAADHAFPSAGRPRWRRWLLLYRPRGAFGWVLLGWAFRFVFWFFGLILLLVLTIAFNEPSSSSEALFWQILLGVSTITVVSSVGARWFDRRAIR